MPRFSVTPLERATEQAIVALALAVRPETSPTWTDVAAAKARQAAHEAMRTRPGLRETA